MKWGIFPLSLLISLILTTTTFAQPHVDFIHCYGDDGHQYFEDIYATANGDFVMCGYSMVRGGRSSLDDQVYVVKANGGGEEIWNLRFGQDSVRSVANTIIELDNGDYVIGGFDNRLVMVARITSDGDIDWIRTYNRGACQGIIELKNNDLALTGTHTQNSYGYLMRLDPDNGDVVWEVEFDEYYHSNFYALREADEGIVVGGFCFIEWQARGRFFIGEFAQEDGEPLWWQNFQQDVPPIEAYDAAFSMTSHPRGFMLSGLHNWGSENSPQEGFTLMTDRDGEEIWRRTRRAVVEEFVLVWYGNCRFQNGDIVQVGLAGWNSNHPVVNWINENGEEIWHELYNVRNLGNFVAERGYLKSVVALRDRSVIACGHVQNIDNENSYDAFIMKLQPLVEGPVIYFRSPEDSILTVLQNAERRFTVGASDITNDEISYLWLRNNVDTLSIDTTALVQFPELGRDTIDCKVISGDLSTSARWYVNVTPFYISDYTPDSLDFTVRRNTSVDFSVSVEALEEIQVDYLWLLSRAEEIIEIGDEATVNVTFMNAGAHQLVCQVSSGDEMASVVWNIEVHSCLWSWYPEALSFRVKKDSTVYFHLEPFNPDEDLYSYAWLLDGDSIDVDSFTYDIDINFANEANHLISGIICDSSDADTIIWDVEVYDPAGVINNHDLIPKRISLFSPTPNPFNSALHINFALPEPANVRLTIFDATGAQIETILNGNMQSGYQSVSWDAADKPTGVYLIELRAGKQRMVTKAVLVK